MFVNTESRSSASRWAVYLGLILSLCLFVVYSANHLSWEISLAFLVLILFFVSLFIEQSSIFILASICLIVFLEIGLDLKLSSVKGISYRNMILGAGLFLLMIKNLKEKRNLFLSCPLNWILILYLIYSFGSLTFNYLAGHYSESFVSLLALYKSRVINPFIIFLIAFNLPESKKEIKLTAYFLLGFFVLVIFVNVLTYYGIVKFISYRELGGLRYFKGVYEPGYRLIGIFKEPNIFASYLVLFLPLLLSTIFFTKKILIRTLLFVTLFWSILVLVLTGSRGGYLGFIVSIGMYLFLTRRMKFLTKSQIFFIIILIIILLVLISLTFKDAFLTNVAGRLESMKDFESDKQIMGRFKFWRIGGEAFLKSPLLGSGWSNSIGVHNSFLFDLVTLGIIGFAIQILLYFIIFRSSFESLVPNNRDFNNFLHLSFLAGFTGFLATMFTLEVFRVFQLLYLYIGLIFRVRMLNE